MTKNKSSLLERIRKTSKIADSSVLEKSKFFTRTENETFTQTPIPALNIALSGRVDGGITCGHTCFAGPSKHFKSSFALVAASAYLRKYPDAVLLFYDSEFGSPGDYFKTFGIDMSRVFHTPIRNIEELKFDIVSQLDNLENNDRLFAIIDSIGNLASKKEIEDAINSKSVADMTRAKALKGLFRMITPSLKMKNVPLISINHTYLEQGLFPRQIISGGTGVIYSADTAWILGRRQEKAGTEIKGYHFVINVEKSRFVREKSQIPITVSFDKGIEEYSGLLDIALVSGHVIKPKNGWYVAHDPKTKTELGKNVRAAECLKKEFWDIIFEKTDFAEYVSNRYRLGVGESLRFENDAETI